MVKNGRLIKSILAVGILSFLGIVIETALNIAFPQLMIDFNMSARTIQWLTTGYMLVSTIIIPFGSYLQKRFKTISLFRMAVSCFLLGTILAGISVNFSLLLIGRLLQGVAAGIGLPLMFTIILEQSPKEQVGMYMGLGTLVIAFAPAVGPVYGGIVLKLFQWQTLFLLIIPVIILTWILGEHSISQTSKTQKIPFDFQGGLLLIVFLMSALFLLLGFTSGNNIYVQLILTLITIITGFFFTLVEKHSNHAVLKVSLFKNWQFTFFLLAFFLLQLMSLSMSFLIPNVLQTAFEQTTATAGLLVLPAAIIDALVSAFAGIIYDKVNQKLPIIFGVAIILLTFIIANFLNPSTANMAFIYISFMFGLGLSYSNIMTFCLSNITTDLKNDGNVIFMTAQSYSGAIGTALTASLLTLAQTGLKNKKLAALKGLKLNYDVLLALSFIVIVCILVCFIFTRLKNKAY
ncbi:MFS transporter [Lactobacillus kullabergensis]|nr:MFS transporter [Lactobacillus kullabergensis]